MSEEKTDFPHCRHCGEHIRWTETLGWVHGALGVYHTIRCEGRDTQAEADDEWMRWFRNE
jgi:hypothetical protein